jgi:hypothetical protein
MQRFGDKKFLDAHYSPSNILIIRRGL